MRYNDSENGRGGGHGAPVQAAESGCPRGKVCAVRKWTVPNSRPPDLLKGSQQQRLGIEPLQQAKHRAPHLNRSSGGLQGAAARARVTSEKSQTMDPDARLLHTTTYPGVRCTAGAKRREDPPWQGRRAIQSLTSALSPPTDGDSCIYLCWACGRGACSYPRLSSPSPLRGA